MDKKLFVNLQGGRKVSGTLRGYDLFLNLVIDEAQEETTPGQKHPIGTVVGYHIVLSCALRLPYLAGYPREQRNIDGNTGGHQIVCELGRRCCFEALCCSCFGRRLVQLYKFLSHVPYFTV